MYIEFVIADNFLLTFLAGATAARIGRNKIAVLRIVIAAAVGTGAAVAYPFLPSNTALQFAVKSALWAVLSVIMYYKTPRACVSSLAFLGCTFAFGGASYALGLILYSDGTAASAFSRKCPLFLVLGTGAACYIGARFCVKRLRATYIRAPYEFGVDVEVFGELIHFAAFLDTGNCVFDDRTGLPVVITDAESFTQKLNGDSLAAFARELPKLRSITARTHGGKTDIRVLRPDRITVYSDRQSHTINATIGIIGERGKRFGSAHELLLNPAAMTEGL